MWESGEVKMRVFVGVDPGAKGGYAVIREELDGGINVLCKTWDNHQFVEDMRNVAQDAKSIGWNVTAAVEKVGAMPGNGAVSMFAFGKSCGYIEGVLAACGIGYQLVPPRVWKKSFSLNNDKKLSIEVCKRLFPNVDLRATERCRTDSDGKAEALLMAEYARRNL